MEIFKWITLATKQSCSTALSPHAITKISQTIHVTCCFMIFFTYNNIEVH